MSINKHRSGQFELFPKHSDSSTESRRVQYQLRELTLTPDNIIVLFIIIIMLTVLFYSLGIERGRQHILSRLEAREINSGQITENGIIGAAEKPPVSESAQAPSGTPETELGRQEPQQPEPQPPVERAAPEPKEQSLENIFTIQVASFKLEKNAQKEADTLSDIGYETFVLPKGSHMIVCVGKFSERTEAKELSARLKSKYRDNLIRRL